MCIDTHEPDNTMEKGSDAAATSETGSVGDAIEMGGEVRAEGGDTLRDLDEGYVETIRGELARKDRVIERLNLSCPDYDTIIE